MVNKILGWSAAKDKSGDYSSGIAHLIVVRGDFGVTACGSTGMTSGQVEKDAPWYAPTECGNCRKTKAYKNWKTLREEEVIPKKRMEGDLRYQLCECGSCGLVATCTPAFDFYEAGGLLKCEACLMANYGIKKPIIHMIPTGGDEAEIVSREEFAEFVENVEAFVGGRGWGKTKVE